MIVIKVEDNLVTIKGHANYSDGLDIVCASVSSIMYTTVNAALRINKNSIKYTDDGNVVTIENISKDNITNDLILNMLSLFKELSSKYSKNIKFEMEE